MKLWLSQITNRKQCMHGRQ